MNISLEQGFLGLVSCTLSSLKSLFWTFASRGRWTLFLHLQNCWLYFENFAAAQVWTMWVWYSTTLVLPWQQYSRQNLQFGFSVSISRIKSTNHNCWMLMWWCRMSHIFGIKDVWVFWWVLHNAILFFSMKEGEQKVWSRREKCFDNQLPKLPKNRAGKHLEWLFFSWNYFSHQGLKVENMFCIWSTLWSYFFVKRNSHSFFFFKEMKVNHNQN